MGGELDLMTRPGPAIPDHTALRDPRLDGELREAGVVVVDAVDPDRLAAIAEVILDVYRGNTTGQHYTSLSEDFEYRRRLYEVVPDLVADIGRELFDGYEFSATTLGFKWPGEDSVLGPHQDITLVDERHHRSYNLWLPFVATDEVNGALRFLKGSHRVLDNLRTMPVNPDFLVLETDQVALEDLELIPTELGQGIVFDHAMLHGSGPNLTPDCRPALIAAFRPVGSKLLHFFIPDPGRPEVECYDVDTAFYREQLVGQQPEREPTEVVAYYGTPRTKGEIVRLSRELVPPTTAVGPGTSTVAGRGAIDSEPVGPQVRRTFLDDELEEQLSRDGYAVFDVLDPDEVARLRGIVDDIFPAERRGFHASNCSNDHDYRRLVDQRVGPALERAIGPLLDDYVLCSTLSTMKFPGDDSGFVVHQDWKMVDERFYRGVNVWCPLVDTDVRNGGLLVLPGSHRILNAVRCGPDFPSSYAAPGLQVSWDEMVPVEVRAGQALMFDHRLLHSSGPNLTDELRPAVVAVMVPAEAQTMHWYLPDPSEDRLEVLAIDRDFFADFEVGVRPDYPAIAEVPFVADALGRDELLASCGSGRGTAVASGDDVPAPGPAPAAADRLPARVVVPRPLRRLARRVHRRIVA